MTEKKITKNNSTRWSLALFNIIIRRRVNPEKATESQFQRRKFSRVGIIRSYSGYTCSAPTFDDVRLLLLSRSQIYPTCDFTFHDERARGSKIKTKETVKEKR